MHYSSCLITGGAGTFGSSYIIKAIENQWHEKLVVFSRDEYKQLKLSNLLKSRFKQDIIFSNDFSLKLKNCDVRFFIGDIRDYERVCLATKGIDLILHAAALKHVPICEYNVEEAVNTNINGTINVIKAAHAQGVSQVISLSTDKSIHPTNLYGSSKMCLEKISLNYRYMLGSETKFNVVRYGNVIGSRGSLIERLTSDDNDIPITDGSMTRFWIPIEKAIDLVRSTIKFNHNGCIFIPLMKALPIDLTFKWLRPNLTPRVIGPRGGEKTHESMLTTEESLHAFLHSSCIIIFPDASQHNITNSPSPELIKHLNLSPLHCSEFLNYEKNPHYSSLHAEPFEKKEFLGLVKNTMVNDLR